MNNLRCSCFVEQIETRALTVASTRKSTCGSGDHSDGGASVHIGS